MWSDYDKARLAGTTDQLNSATASSMPRIYCDLSAMLESNLGLPENSLKAHPDTRVLGSIPEFDSMSVVNLLIDIEEAYGIIVNDDELDADIFETIGSLSDFIQSRMC